MRPQAYVLQEKSPAVLKGVNGFVVFLYQEIVRRRVRDAQPTRSREPGRQNEPSTGGFTILCWTRARCATTSRAAKAASDRSRSLRSQWPRLYPATRTNLKYVSVLDGKALVQHRFEYRSDIRMMQHRST